MKLVEAPLEGVVVAMRGCEHSAVVGPDNRNVSGQVVVPSKVHPLVAEADWRMAKVGLWARRIATGWIVVLVAAFGIVVINTIKAEPPTPPAHELKITQVGSVANR